MRLIEFRSSCWWKRKLPLGLLKSVHGFKAFNWNIFIQQDVAVGSFSGCTECLRSLFLVQIKKNHSFSVLSEHVWIVIQEFNWHKVISRPPITFRARLLLMSSNLFAVVLCISMLWRKSYSTPGRCVRLMLLCPDWALKKIFVPRIAPFCRRWSSIKASFIGGVFQSFSAGIRAVPSDWIASEKRPFPFIHVTHTKGTKYWTDSNWILFLLHSFLTSWQSITPKIGSFLYDGCCM